MDNQPTILIPKINPDTTSIPEIKSKSKLKKILLTTGVIFLILIIYLGVTGLIFFNNAKLLVNDVKNAIVVGKNGDINAIKLEIPKVSSQLDKVLASYKFISWTKYTPYFGGYIGDLGHGLRSAQAGLSAFSTVLNATEPYIKVLGFSGGEAETAEKTTQERIDFVVGAIPELLPHIDTLSSHINIIQHELSQIDPNRYPENYKGVRVREKIIGGQEILKEVSDFITNGKPLLASAPYLLGMDSPRTYLVLFQNDKELRPTGGFMTAYSIMKVENAKFEPVISDDIYNLDAKYKPSIPAPEPLVKYIKGPYILSKNLRLRDMNWSPDFEESMDLFSDSLDSINLENIDGIIAVDTQLLVNLLNVIGPIGVPGFGNFTTDIDPECNCPQVIHELESFADIEGPIIWDPLTGKIIQRPPNSDNRKKIIGPLMNSILANAMGLPKDKLPRLLEAGVKSVMEKHVLFYLHDEKVQKAVADFGLGGKIDQFDGDYLHINDANLGGRKSNLYVTQEVAQEIEIKKGEVVKTLTLTYKNPEKHDGWLNSVLPNWVRVYVPEGSELLAVEGLEDEAAAYEDLGKTVFSGLFKLRPEGVSKVTFKYKLPIKVGKEYRLLIQKQPGTNAPLYTLTLGKYDEEFLLTSDKEIKIKI